GLELALEHVVTREQGIGPFLPEHARKLAADPAVPIDQRPVAVERRPPVGRHPPSLPSAFRRGVFPRLRSQRDHAHVQRKTVTVLFCDAAGSTALGESIDPEALRALLARYFERMRGIVGRHEGTVEKFIGDAVMAVFGVPTVHEDDALRGVRAAAEMRDALPELGLQARIGVNTGIVVTGTEERLATGDAVNVAARLEQTAHPDEVLIGG